MILYRIAREKYAQDLTGRGGLLSTARWHDHLPVIYASSQSSTCILEKRVHLEPGEIHHDLQMTVLFVPDKASYLVVDPGDLPAGWQAYPAPAILQQIGNAWLKGMTSLLLYVPSAIDPYAQNVLINTLHPEAKHIRVRSVAPFRFDPRLTK
jgi:RES domain-containing protein